MSPPERRILMTTDAVGGVWTFSIALAAALCGRGYDVTLVTLGPAPRPEQMAPLSRVRGLTVIVTDLALEWIDPEGEDVPRARTTLLAIADRVRPDLIHLNSFREASFELPAPKLVVAHSDVSSWWQACRPDVPMEARWWTYVDHVARGLNGATRWVAPTLAYRDWIEAAYRTRTSGHVIWNGVNAAIAPQRKLPFVLAAGRLWDEAKGLATLVAAAGDGEFDIRVAGPKQLADSAEAAIDVPHVTHLGQLSRDRLIDEMCRAMIFAAPAVYEPFGLGILEAAHCGCALVLSDIPSLRELWEEAAVFVPPGDAAALRAALQRVLTEQALRTRLQRAARKRAARYSLARMLRAYGRHYAAVLAPPARRAAGARMELRA